MLAAPVVDTPASVAGTPSLLVVDAVASALIAPMSFVLERGACTVVRGPSGAGKTRLLRLIADLDEGTGEVLLQGAARSSMPAPAWRRQVVYQGAESAWWQPTVRAHFLPEQYRELDQLAAALALEPDRLDADLSLLSTGERQRATLIRSLLARPKVLLLDEPTSALDRDNIARVEQLLLSRMQEGLGLMLITHADEQAARLGGQLVQVQRRA
ncbi:ABC transporter ATP-binding protein [Silvimonas iriomotensis]|uniref:ABC transporter ATP-binding protein n=1 Tax=Silvimonas iriomotensis TaxID=449662 RepID=A0ABQ2P609_9NEIS|nr:ATP-binding cassette domain-containing protein [Silvimonas iriomotensis]GGP18816.1 ABC transporter ATP-binding protein [Silvimonas iriomotensis]